MKGIKNILKILMLAAVLVSCGEKMPDGIYAKMKTSKGEMLIKLYYKSTPVTVANFISLAEGVNPYVSPDLKNAPYYNGVIFHRVIKDFMIQGGDKTGTGSGTPGYRFKDEIVDTLRHSKKGTLSMANAGPNTNGSQFFIIHKPTPFLDGKHTVFGEVLEGINVVDSIANVKTSQDIQTKDKPIEDVTIQEISILKLGKDAKKFDEVAVFSNYYQEQKKKEKDDTERRKQVSEAAIKEFNNQKQQSKTFPSGIKIFYLREGAGMVPQKGSIVLVNYAGYLQDTGKLFDTSWLEVAEQFGEVNEVKKRQNGYAPLKVPFDNTARLIEGFKEALLTLKQGDKVRVFIPSELGYGERGGGGVIPPNADLVFDIELYQVLE